MVLIIQQKTMWFPHGKNKSKAFAEVWPFHPDLCEERHGRGHQEKENHLKTVPNLRHEGREKKNETTVGWFT